MQTLESILFPPRWITGSGNDSQFVLQQSAGGQPFNHLTKLLMYKPGVNTAMVRWADVNVREKDIEALYAVRKI